MKYWYNKNAKVHQLQDDILVSSRCNPEDMDITFHVGKVKVNLPFPKDYSPPKAGGLRCGCNADNDTPADNKFQER